MRTDIDDIYDEVHKDELGADFKEYETLANEKFIKLLKIIDELKANDIFALNNQELINSLDDFKKYSLEYAKIIKEIKYRLIYLKVDSDNILCLKKLGSNKTWKHLC